MAAHMPMTFDEALATLKRATVFGINPSLEGVTDLVAALGDPQATFASVQITGTNGKTSTARITAALLQAEGLATGLYTSPELERYPERIEVGGRVVSDTEFASAIAATVAAAETLRGSGAIGTPAGFTEFELLTAAALWLFREQGVSWACLEVGMGGRWDATSVVSPAVAVGFPVILPLLVSSARPAGSSGVTENEVAGSPPAWLRTLGVITWS